MPPYHLDQSLCVIPSGLGEVIPPKTLQTSHDGRPANRKIHLVFSREGFSMNCGSKLTIQVFGIFLYENGKLQASQTKQILFGYIETTPMKNC